MRVAIIGGGICGLYLARKLAEKGEEVTVFEQKKEIGKETCSGLFSYRILDFIPESKNLVQNQIEYCLIHFPKKTLKIKFSRKFFVMNHSELDMLVASLAEKSGVKIILNCPINSLPDLERGRENPSVLPSKKTANEVSVRNRGFLKSDTFERAKQDAESGATSLCDTTGFDKIIGCDGANSVIRKSLGLKNPQFRLGIQGFIPKFDNSNFVETRPVKEGFVWRIPRGKETEYGIISNPKGAKLLFDNFLKKNNLRLERVNSAIIPQGLIIPANQKITLCGDAAGLTKPWSGGGVVWSLIAANILLKNFPDFLKYKTETKRFFLPKIVFSKILKKMVYLLGFNLPQFLPKNYQIEGDFLK